MIYELYFSNGDKLNLTKSGNIKMSEVNFGSGGRVKLLRDHIVAEGIWADVYKIEINPTDCRMVVERRPDYGEEEKVGEEAEEELQEVAPEEPEETPEPAKESTEPKDYGNKRKPRKK